MTHERLGRVLRPILSHTHSASSQPINVFHFNIIATSTHVSSAGSPIQFVPPNLLYQFPTSPMRATCNVSCILLNFNNSIIFAQDCTLWRSSLRNFLHSAALVLLTCRLVSEYLYLFIFAKYQIITQTLTALCHSHSACQTPHVTQKKSNITAARNRHMYLTVNSSMVNNKILTIVPGFSYSSGKVIS
jgi:hypothetical protein